MWMRLVPNGHIVLLQGWRSWTVVVVLVFLGVGAVFSGTADALFWLVTHRTVLRKRACAACRLVYIEIPAGLVGLVRRALSGGDS